MSKTDIFALTVILLKEIVATAKVNYVSMDTQTALRQIANCLTYKLLLEELDK